MIKLNQEIVCKSNALVEASYRLTLYEQRIVLAAITQVRRDEQVTDDEIYFVSAAEIAEATGVEKDRVYSHLREAIARLFDRRFTIYKLPNSGGPVRRRGGRRGRVCRWIQAMEEDAPAGMVGVRFSKDILPYLSQLSTEYTKYMLRDVGAMTSSYAIRLYELIQQWRSVGKRSVSIEWLREAFELQDKHQAISDLKKIVIKPAVEQINAHTPFYLEWSQQKTGRRITHFVFSFGLKEDRIKEQAAALRTQEKEAAEEKKRLERAEAEAAREALRQKREAMKKKKPWEDAEHPIEPGEEKGDYFRRIAKIRGLDQPKPVATDTVATATDTDSTADDPAATERCDRTPDMFEAFNEGESK